MPNIRKVLFIATLGLIILLGWQLQNWLFFNWDVSTLIQATKKLLAGGKYVTDFFTPNPPFILYLYTPPTLLSAWLDSNIVSVFRIYVLLIAAVSWVLCYLLLGDIKTVQRQLPIYLLLLVIAFLFWVFPLFNLGQRDHLVVIFSMPYFLAAAYRLDLGKLHDRLAVPVGIWAGLGFAIKPHFLIAFIFIEFYFAIRQRNVFAWLRTETLIILGILVAYVVSIILFHREYLTQMLPYLMHLYYQSSPYPFSILYLNIPFLSFFLPIALFVIQYNDELLRNLRIILLTAFVGFIFSFMLQRSAFIYHIIPAMSLEILCLSLQAFTFVKTRLNDGKHLYFNYAFGGLLIVFLFTMPAYSLYLFFGTGYGYKIVMFDEIIKFIESQPQGQSLLVLSRSTMYGFPLIDYSQTRIAQRYDSIWMIDSLVHEIKTVGSQQVINHIKQHHYFLIKMVSEDLKNYQPSMVFLEKIAINNIIFDYLYFFNQDVNFKKEWKNYQYITTLKFKGLNQNLEVYRRKL